MNATILLEWADGSSMNVTLQVSLPPGCDCRRDFESIARAVRDVIPVSRVRRWSEYDVRLSIIVVAPCPGTDADRNLVSNAVCKGTGHAIIPRADLEWRMAK